MINHCLALLMNVHGVQEAGRRHMPGAEYVPPAYRPVTLSSSLKAVRQLLFGTSPDSSMLHYRCRQLLALLHSCELEQFVLALDPRVTYDLQDDPYFDLDLFRPRVLQMHPFLSKTVYLGGTATPPDSSGRMQHTWDVLLQHSGGTTATVTMRWPQISSVQSVTLTGGISSLVYLPGSQWHFRVQGPFVADPETGLISSFSLTSLSRPQADLGQLAASLEVIGSETIAELFAVGTERGSQEPRQTFRRLWEDHFDLAHRLGGAVLALVYETEHVRTGGVT